MDRSRVAKLAAIAVLLVAAPSRGDEPGPAAARLPARVRVEPPACARPPLDVDAFLRLLRIELREDAVTWVADDAPADDALATVTVAIAPCEPGARAISVGVASISRRRAELRSVSIGDTPPSARPRVLALAVSELLRSLWPGLAAPAAAATATTAPATAAPAAAVSGAAAPAAGALTAGAPAAGVPAAGTPAAGAPTAGASPPVVPPTAGSPLTPVPPASAVAPPSMPPLAARPSPFSVPVPSVPPPAHLPCPTATCPAEPRPARVHAWAGFEARTLIGSGSFAGGRAGTAIGLSATVPILLTIDAGGLYGRAFNRLGAVDVVVASGALGLAGRIALGRAVLELGPSVELGALWARGVAYASATAASSGSTLVVTTSAEAAIRGRLGDRIWLDGALRGGAVLKGATLLAGEREASGFTGAMLGIRTGVGVDF